MNERERIARTAADFLAGRIDWLSASRRVASLAVDERDDPDVLVVIAIESETDHFPGAEQRPLWDPAALVVKDAEMADYLTTAAPDLHVAWERIVARSGPLRS